MLFWFWVPRGELMSILGKNGGKFPGGCEVVRGFVEGGGYDGGGGGGRCAFGMFEPPGTSFRYVISGFFPGMFGSS